MNKQILWVNDQGYVACVDHLWYGAKEMFLANKKLRLVYSSSTSWQRLTKAEVAELNITCEGCSDAEVKESMKARLKAFESSAPAPETPAPAPKSSAHANCSHEKTPSARAKCRRESAKNS